MNLKTSFFNKAVYKSLLRRYKWGSVLYFLLLFMTVVLPLLSDYDFYLTYSDTSLVYEDIGGIVSGPMLFAMGVAVVVGALVFRFIHSKKASIFTHSMPVNRTSVYISTLAGAFTLMGAPVVLTGLILVVMALTGYSAVLSVGSCLVWFLINLMCLFVMFSFSCFTAVLTGNTIAYFGLNMLFHLLLPVLFLCFGIIANNFLFGYYFESTLAEFTYENTFFLRIWEVTHNFEICVKFVVQAVLYYIVAGILYKKRKTETAEDVAGFKCLNAIFKYLLTFLSAMFTFMVFAGVMIDSIDVFAVIYLIVCGVTYFASEMILKKSFKVWEKSYKGFLIFTVLFALAVYTVVFTSFFGYETYVPDKDEVATVSSDFITYGYSDDPELIGKMTEIHKGIICKDIPVYENLPYNQFNFDIYYRMKDGREIKRSYPMATVEINKIINEFYEVESYKSVFEPPLGVDEKDIRYVVYKPAGDKDWILIDGKEFKELHKCVVEDIKNSSYDEIYSADTRNGAVNKLQYFYTYKGEIRDATYYLNDNFVKTNQWLGNNIAKLHGVYFNYTNFMSLYSDFIIINNDVFHRLSEEYEKANYSGLTFEGFLWTVDELAGGNEVAREITEYNLENSSIILLKDKEAEIVYEYLQLCDNAASTDGRWYIYGEISNGKFVVVDAITEDEVADFKQYVCK